MKVILWKKMSDLIKHLFPSSLALYEIINFDSTMMIIIVIIVDVIVAITTNTRKYDVLRK